MHLPAAIALAQAYPGAKALRQNGEGKQPASKTGFGLMAQDSAASVMPASGEAGASRLDIAGSWNVVITVFQDGFRRAIKALRKHGPVERSPYHNVLVMAAEDPIALLEAIERQAEADPALYDSISRVAPAMRVFEFHAAEDFLTQAKTAVTGWVPQLAGRSFHVRLRRRGPKHGMKSPDVERDIGEALLEALAQRGSPGSLCFSDPDAVVAIDTLDARAGLGLWTREDIARHRLLRPD